MEQRRRHLEETLNPNIALRITAYDDQGKMPCDADTRVDILADISTWVNNVSPKSQNFFWMTGDPGCGKSAIAASLARLCKDEGTLWAQFFINRNIQATTNPRVYFPSIAYQMAKHSSNSTVSKTIYEILKTKPSLLDKISNDQALKLFVEVMQVACDVTTNKPVVVVIDGLDETNRESLEDTATIFSRLFKELQRPNAKVFISSRTDNEITKPFFKSLRSNEKHVKHVHLDTSDPSSIEDVSKFLSSKVGKLVEDENLNLEICPGRERFERLCLRAAGLFIWAVTVVKLFKEQLRLHGPEYLNDLLDAITAEGMNDVNKLYQSILAITYMSSATFPGNAWAHETFRWVVGFIIALKEPLSVGDVDALLELRRTSTSNPIDILRFATNLRTVLVAGTDEITKATIPRLHKSFVEFITSDKADKEFRIDLDVVDVEIALRCLHLVKKLANGDSRSKIPPGSVRYAIQNWTRHLPNEGMASGVAVFGDNEALLRAFTSAAALRSGVMFVAGDYRTHMYDSGQGFPPPVPFRWSPSSAIKTKVGNPIYSVAVSMDGQMVASGHRSGAVRIWDSRSHRLVGEPLRGHSETVTSLCFSPDSRWLVSGSVDKRVRVWNCRTGQAGSPLLGHTSHVYSVRTDGRLIISGSSDTTIRIWDFATGEPIGLPINAGNPVRAVALFNDGRIIAAAGGSVCLWDVKTRLRIVSMTHPDVRTVALSPDNSRIASGSTNIRIWDAQTHTQIWGFDSYIGVLYSVSFSPDGRWIASGSDDGTVRVLNSNTGQLIDPPLRGQTRITRSVAFSSDNRQVISGGVDKVSIWSRSPNKEWPMLSEQITTIRFSQNTNAATPFEGNAPVVAACYSPDYTLYSASTLDGHVFLWNTADLVWEQDTAIHPIHLLKLSADRLIISSPDGSTCTWDLVDGKPMRQTPTRSGPQLNAANIRQFKMQSSSSTDNSIVRWIPFKTDAGLWAYIEGTFIRFDNTGGGSVTFIDVGDFAR